MKNIIEELKNNNTSNKNNETTNNINVTLNKFGEEDVSYLNMIHPLLQIY
jgi:hypothetical protein